MGDSFADDVRQSFNPVNLPHEIHIRFDVVELLSQNAFGETYLLREKDGGKLYVLKSRLLSGLQPETEILQGLTHKGIPVFEPPIVCGDTVFSLREYVDGLTLEEYAQDRQPVTEDLAVHVIRELCGILSLLHSQPMPIIHRDIKPSNVVIDPDSRAVTLIDFGVARKYGDNPGGDTVLVATRGFAAPEQFGFAQTDIRTDIYALGVLLRFMLTGSIQQGGTVGSTALDRIVQKCTAFDPKDRYQSVDDLRKTFLKHGARKRRPAKHGVTAALAVCAVIAAGFFLAKDFVFPHEPPGVNTPIPRDGVYTFVEPLIEQAVRFMLHKPEGEPVTYRDLERVTGLYIYGTNPLYGLLYRTHPPDERNGDITSIDDLRFMPNLRVLLLYRQPLADISPLVYCMRLEELHIYYSNIFDISVLTALPRLRMVILSNTLVRDYSPLERIASLNHLTVMFSSAVRRIPDLGSFPNIQYLNLHATLLDDLDSAGQMPWLEELIISNTNVSDYSLLNDRELFPRLRSLWISEDMMQYIDTLTRDEINITIERGF
jgi:hypothetical protein